MPEGINHVHPLYKRSSVPILQRKYYDDRCEKSFHDIRLNRDEDIYIQINFRSSNLSHQYAAVLEDNPSLKKNLHLNEEDKTVADQFLSHTLFDFQEKKLLTAIDEALDNNDKTTFAKLAAQLKTLRET